MTFCIFVCAFLGYVICFTCSPGSAVYAIWFLGLAPAASPSFLGCALSTFMLPKGTLALSFFTKPRRESEVLEPNAFEAPPLAASLNVSLLCSRLASMLGFSANDASFSSLFRSMELPWLPSAVS